MEHNIITKELKIDLGQALWQARRDKKMHISNVAEAIGANEKQIDLVEMGRKFDYSLTRKLAKYYGKSVKIILE